MDRTTTEIQPVVTDIEQAATEKNQDAEETHVPAHDAEDKPYSVFTQSEKRIITLCVGASQFFSPVSSSIYFPSLAAIADDLHVSNSLINLTITTFLITQGLAPAFVGGFSDTSGRRPAYFVCFIIYLGANIGLAVQNSYSALMVLRAFQSAGSSATVALANAVVADIVTSQERGVYMSWVSVPSQSGSSLGPIIGGVLGQYLGWHSIFWFLVICTGVVFVPCAFLMAETGRKIVDNGSIPPPKLRRCYLNTRVEKRLVAQGQPVPYEKRDELARQRKMKFPNPFETLKIVLTREAGFILFYIGILSCGYYAVIALIPSQFGHVYKFNQLHISFCYLPLGVGSVAAGLVRGRIIDARYKHHAKRLGFSLEYNRYIDLTDFPIERARLEVAVPTIALGCACFIGFGWMVQYEVNLAGPLIFLFIIGFCVSASLNTVAVLLIDIFPGRAGSAAAASNIMRCWLGAGATSGVEPMIRKVGIGWTTTFFGGLIVVLSPILWWVMEKGPGWRREAKDKKEREAARQ